MNYHIVLTSSLSLPTSHINEDKRKTEGQKQIFDVVYEVDGCPVSGIKCTWPAVPAESLSSDCDCIVFDTQ